MWLTPPAHLVPGCPVSLLTLVAVDLFLSSNHPKAICHKLALGCRGQ